MTTTADTPMTVRVYAANGTTLLCEFPYFTSLNILDVYNNVGSYTWQWSLNSPGASNLISDTNLQIAVMMDRRDGNGFQEVWRGFYEQDNYDPSMNESAIVQASGRSIIALLQEAIIYPQAGVGSLTTSWSFAGASAGKVMNDLLTAAQARGCFPLLTWDFTDGQDSSGAAWTQSYTNAFDAGGFMMDLLISLSQGGLCDFSMTGTVLHMYNPKTTLAVDHSSTVFIRKGREIVTSPMGRDRTQIATVMLAQGDNGLNIETIAGTEGTIGRIETYMSQSGVTDAATLTYWAEQALGAIDDQLISLTPTYVIDTSKGTPIPWKDYFSGNYISLDVNGTTTKYQVAQVAAQCGPGGPTFIQPTLNNVFYSREILVANALNKLSGGIIAGPATGVTAAPGPNPTVPGTPAFTPTSIYTAAYFSPATGTTLAQMELQWTTPANTDGTTMIDGYQYLVQYKLASTPLYPIKWSQLQGKPWNTLQGNPWSNPLDSPQNQQWTTVTVGIDSNNLVIQGLICGETYDFQIACTDVSGNTGTFSATSAFVTATDDLAPNQPDAPTVFASMVAVQVLSDMGSEAGGTFNLANDLDHLEVHYSYDPAFVPVPGITSPTYLGKLIANAGMMAAGIVAVGTFQVTSTTGIYIKLIAVDISGNSSPPSPGSGVTAVLIDDTHISSLSVSKLIAGTVTATIILGGTIETAATGARAVMDSLGFHAYNAAGFKVFDVSPSSTTIILASGAGGNEFTVDCSGSYPTLYLYDITGTKPAFINAVEFGSQAGAGIGINTATYTSGLDSTTVGQRVYLQGPSFAHLAVIDSTQSVSGGGFVIGDTTSYMTVQKHGTEYGGLEMNWDATNSDASWRTVGYTMNNGNMTGGAFPNWCIFAGFLGGMAGAGAASFGYGSTMAGPVVTMPGVIDTTASPATRGCYISVSTITGFSIAWNSTTVSYALWHTFRVR